MNNMAAKTADIHLAKPMYTGEPMARPSHFGDSGAASALAVHPLQATESSFMEQRDLRDYELVRAVQGKAAAMSLAMERRLAGQSDRLPGLISSHLQARILRGCDTEIGFEDQLNLACHSESAGQPHALMEKRLGLL